jgi:hypothetical protein
MNEDSETGESKYKLAVSLLLSSGVLGFGLTSWQKVAIINSGILVCILYNQLTTNG